MSDQVLPTPEYVQAILERNRKLWESEDSAIDFQDELTRWVTLLTSRLTNLRRDKRKKPDVSVVIPAHNEELHLLATLDSISMQKTQLSIEVVVVANNCSKDDRTAFLARAAGANVIEYHMKEKEIKPIPYARQKGLEAASGKVIVNTDADIVAMPQWLDRIVPPLLEDKEIGFTTSHSHLYHQEDDEKIANNDSMRRLVREFFGWTGLIGLGNNMAFRKKEALKLGGYNLSIYPSEDTEIGLRLSIFQQKKAKLIKQKSSAIWMSPRRVKAYGDNVILSHMDWQGRILDVRDTFGKKRNP